ncbi:hypothetical protein GALMADRAFT_276398 [Galerina marginata CBS 339.88]|uniref:Autophagy-related protein 2 n=1 Tax=Galerina marginata (strain CBS 339.88) TaxID=685588 RepID=A0A067TRR6_GALM3|nr:hypothetical protein GALMADRAFT_276398 [Galerina marginata CBS 339.88]
MAWYSSWIPGLPSFNFAIPTSIQGRFLSFVLKKSLGHLLKPGQLDHHQIDSQIGSGYVQVNDLQLNPEAINTYLEGLPLALYSGTISSIKARIPWPNPLASTLGFSLKSLHLVIHVVPFADHRPGPNVDLTESVASVAETFIHQELSPAEEASLWQSLHQEGGMHSSYEKAPTVPGGLGDSIAQEESPNVFDTDPAGVSVFASLIERFLARFEFDAQDIKITLLHPENIQLNLCLGEIQYHTDGKTGTPASLPRSNLGEGEKRTLSVSGVTLSSHNLIPTAKPSFFHTTVDFPASNSPSVATSRPHSRSSSESSIDEATQFMMSQSLAALPPRPPSSTGSASSSMYESAISSANMHSSQDNVKDNGPDIPSQASPPNSFPENPEEKGYFVDAVVDVGETLLSFGSQPILLHLITPSPEVKTSEDDDPFLTSTEPDTKIVDGFQVAISVGIIACAIGPWQIKSLLRLGQALFPSTGAPPDESRFKETSQPPALKINTQVCGIVLLLLSSITDERNNISIAPHLAGFLDKPLVPPSLEQGYTRVYLDTISASLAVSNAEDQLKRNTISANTLVHHFNSSIADLSIFSFMTEPESRRTSSLSAFPILLTDVHLPSQYPGPHLHPHASQPYPDLPIFDVIDWTDNMCRNFGTKLTQWRCQPPKSSSRFKPNSDARNTPSATETPTAVAHPAVRIVGRRLANINKRKQGETEVTESLEMHIAPLNIRIDLEHLLRPGGLLSFFEDSLPLETNVSDRVSVSSEETVDMYTSKWNIAGKGKTAQVPTFDDPTHRSSPNSTIPGFRGNSTLSVDFPVVRLAIRCPPPQFEDRSGTLIVDLHDIALATGPKLAKASARFSSDPVSPTNDVGLSEDAILLRTEFSRAVIACSTVRATTAFAFASIGPLTDDEYSSNAEEIIDFPSLKPRISVLRPNIRKLGTTPVFALSVDLPALHVDVSKPGFDALQYWADDISQLLEHLSATSTDETEGGYGDSRDTSLIGSRFFTRSRSGSGSALSTGASEGAASVVKLTITEAFIKIMVPRTDTEKSVSRSFDVKASDVDILVELNLDNKQQTILTVGLMDLVIENTEPRGRSQRFLSLTSPHSLSVAPKSIVKLRFITSTIPGLNTKETRIKLTLCGFTYSFFPDVHWISDLAAFAKNPPGTFESVIPSDRTRIFVKILDGSIRLLAPENAGAIVSHIQELDFSTDVVGDSRDSSFHILATALAILAIDNTHDQEAQADTPSSVRGLSTWTAVGYALLAEISDLDMKVVNQLNSHPLWKVIISRIIFRLHLCADTMMAVTAFIHDFGGLFKPAEEGTPDISARGPALVNQQSPKEGNTLMSSVEDLAFKRIPEVGAAPDMIYDDLPTNLDYLDESVGIAAGLRELREDDLDEFDHEEIDISGATDDPSVISKIGGETIKIFEPQGLEAIEDYFLTTPPDKSPGISYAGNPNLSVRVLDGHFTLFLYDGYDWARTRKTIEEEVKEMRKRLAKIRQLVANGQIQDPAIEDTSALLFNSVHIGLDQDDNVLGEPSALIAAIDEELRDDLETASQSSWQSLRPTSTPKPRVRSTRVHGKRLTRSKAPSMEFCFAGLRAEFDQYQQDDPLVSRTFVTVRDLEILDHIKTSTWKKFLTELRSDSRGNIRETESNMVRIELRGVRPVPGNSSEEARLKAKILPLRLYVDQDAVDFLKKFFSFKDSHASNSGAPSSEGEAYIQLAEIFPIDLKLDYKPRRVDYGALMEGRTIELMNFFHFDGAEMTLRHITLAGVTGWPRLFEMLNDLWTPDVKATQLVEVISGVAPIRSIVNVGSGVADLILLPIAQYKKDGRIVRGVQKGATAFVKSTAIEAIKMGAKLATGTQVILEQTEGVFGGRFETPITAEPVQVPFGDDLNFENEDDDESGDLMSKYAQQPADLKEGVQSAYKSLQRNFSSAAQTILAVPMEVYDRSGNESQLQSLSL